MKKIINPWRNHEGYELCSGLQSDNPMGCVTWSSMRMVTIL